MHKLAAILEAGGDRLKETAARQPHHPRGTGPMKFIYATGARPLDGYTIKRGIGVGGFGEVYFATSDAGKEVALKRVQRNLDVEIRGVTQCLNLKHANLISIYDIRYDDFGEGWVVMEYVAGESLKDVLDRNPNGMPTDEIAYWFTGIASGVAYLHDHGIVHRDLKPGNIFSDEGIVKIGDYGLSKFISCSRRSGQTESVGTFHYMAPEIGKGVYGKEIDVYALGIMLFELLTGRVPFDGESSQEIIMKHLTADPDLSVVSPRFARVIERALFKDPAKRYSRVSDMLHALQFGESFANPATEPRGAGATAPPIVAEPVLADADGTLYINEEGIATDEIVFGPVVEVVTATVEKPPVVCAGSPNREPIAAAVGDGFHNFARWWAPATTPVKVAVVIGVILILLFFSHLLAPMAMFLGAAYLVYFGVRAIVLSSRPQQATPAPTTVGVRTEMPDRHRSRHATQRKTPWREQARQELGRKPVGQRFAEITGSFQMAAVACAVLCLIILVASGHKLDAAVATWSMYTWMTVTTILGSWSVLALGKFWEGRDGDHVLRRFLMMVVGLIVGAVALAMSKLLLVDLSARNMFNVLELPSDIIPSDMYTATGAPLATAFLAYFASLFLILRWWKQVDPLRRTRFSLWATFVCALCAMLVPWQIPWGFLLVTTISVAIQLSAPWMNSQERTRVRRDVLEA